MREPLRYDHYQLLGLPRDASSRAIRAAYRERAKQVHPDRNSSPRAAEIFHAVHAAYTVLIDKEQRAVYDERLLYYRPAGQSRVEVRQPLRHRTERPPGRMARSAFIGLHITGLCFGITLITGILVGVTFLEWPAFTVLFCLPGIAIIPDSLAGIRTK